MKFRNHEVGHHGIGLNVGQSRSLRVLWQIFASHRFILTLFHFSPWLLPGLGFGWFFMGNSWVFIMFWDFFNQKKKIKIKMGESFVSEWIFFFTQWVYFRESLRNFSVEEYFSCMILIIGINIYELPTQLSYMSYD